MRLTPLLAFAYAGQLLVCCLVAATPRSNGTPRVEHRARRPAVPSSAIVQQYLHVLKLSLTGQLLRTPSTDGVHDPQKRQAGLDWPLYGLTMVGYSRLTNVEKLLTGAIADDVPGEFVECGVWRGGASMLAKAVLDAHGVHNRGVHLVDSFEGLPKATQGRDDNSWSKMEFLKVDQDYIKDAFAQLQLLDHRVSFHKGFFRYSLPVLRQQLLSAGKRIALLRMDGDMYESTMDILYNLYDLVAVDGCIIIDDFSIPVCRQAIDEFMVRHGLSPNFVAIDAASSYFCKDAEVALDMAWYTAFNASRSAE